MLEESEQSAQVSLYYFLELHMNLLIMKMSVKKVRLGSRSQSQKVLWWSCLK